VTFREKEKPNAANVEHALPFWSVNTLDEARHIQILHCKLQWGTEERYVLVGFGGEIEDLMALPTQLGLQA
jgi:hypothetical protein